MSVISADSWVLSLSRLTLLRAGTATPGNCASYRCELIEQIAVMRVLLEIVAPGIGNDAAVEDMNFADPPRIKPALCEEFFQQSVSADLDVPHTELKA